MTLSDFAEINRRNNHYCYNNGYFCEQCPLGRRRCLRWFSMETISEIAEERAVKAKEFLDENAK